MGQAKTRLAADVGRVHALRVYRAMSAKTMRECEDPRWDTILYITPDRDRDAQFGGVWPAHLKRLQQNSGNLTDRLARMFALKGPTIAIGTDAPQIRKRDIAEAFTKLKSNQAVFGPADDGGFWLIGLNGPASTGLFENVRWSHPNTFEDMKARVQGKIALLRTLKDVDTGAALTHYRNSVRLR
jgi:rSAM/selenodomain-associated transferase 1